MFIIRTSDDLGHLISSDVLKVSSEYFFCIFIFSISFTFYFSSLQQKGSRYLLQIFYVRSRVKGDNFQKNFTPLIFKACVLSSVQIALTDCLQMLYSH